MIENSQVPPMSIMIPTWNNLEMLKLCVKSIKKNSKANHQILIFVNDGSDGTLDWVKQEGFEYYANEKNVGICFALNSLRTLVKTDYIVYANDDMYLLPDWDTAYWQQIKEQKDDFWFFSSVLIQPREGGARSMLNGYNYGTNPQEFQEEKLLKEYKDIPHNDYHGASMPLNICSTHLWDLVGGYSIEFSPGMYSDPDFVAKLWMAGVRNFKVLNSSRVYHFEAVSTQKVKKNCGQAQFLFKWGVNSSSFREAYTFRGKVWGQGNPKSNFWKKMSILKGAFKRFGYFVQGKNTCLFKDNYMTFKNED